MLNASSSILCRKRTTGASSTSATACSLDSAGVGSDLVELELGADDAVDGFGGADRRSLDHARQLVVLGDDPVDAHLGRELDLLGRLLVGRVGRRDDQAVVALAQHDDAIGLAELLVEQILGQALRVDGIEIEQRGAEGAGQGVRQIARRHRAGARQFGDEAGAAGLRLLIDLFGRLRRQLAGRNQRARQAQEGRSAKLLWRGVRQRPFRECNKT